MNGPAPGPAVLVVTLWHPTPQRPAGGVFVAAHVDALRAAISAPGTDPGAAVAVVHLDRELPWGRIEHHGGVVRVGAWVPDPWLRKLAKATWVPWQVATARLIRRVVEASTDGPSA